MNITQNIITNFKIKEHAAKKKKINQMVGVVCITVENVFCSTDQVGGCSLWRGRGRGQSPEAHQRREKMKGGECFSIKLREYEQRDMIWPGPGFSHTLICLRGSKTAIKAFKLNANRILLHQLWQQTFLFSCGSLEVQHNQSLNPAPAAL